MKNHWSKALALAGLLALPSAAAMAATVEMVLTPPTAQVSPEECVVKLLLKEGTATFTTTTGEVADLSPNRVLCFTGGGRLTQSDNTGTILNFASAAGDQTASVGGGGGGGLVGNIPTGGNNSGNNAGNPPTTTTTTNLTGGGGGTVGAGGGPSSSVSP